MIEGLDVTVDEEFYNDGISNVMEKQIANSDNYYQNPDPFLVSSTLVLTGSCKVVVCAVGANSRRGV